MECEAAKNEECMKDPSVHSFTPNPGKRTCSKIPTVISAIYWFSWTLDLRRNGWIFFNVERKTSRRKM